jgi:hypothetical protein
MAVPAAGDEGRHRAGAETLWNESYYFDWFAEDGSIGGYVRVGFYPNLGKVWYWACVVGRDRKLVTVLDHEVALPANNQSLELRSDGVWADHNIEAPLAHVSVSLESFGLELADPCEVYRDPRGIRVPFGFELDWETDRAAYLWPPVTPRYEIPCKVSGEVIVGSQRLEISGWGQRDHSWGASRDWWSNRWCWSAGRLSDGTRWHTAGAFFEDSEWGVAYVLTPDSDDFIEADVVSVEATYGEEGLATAARLRFAGLTLEVEPIAWSPVLLVDDAGREARFPRALAKFTADDGREGFGWIEFNQPQI